jgi:hypothetical protein
MNFVAVCGNANLPVNGTTATYCKSLKESGVSVGPSQTLPEIKERFAALTWVRYAVANAIDPTTWPSLLSAPLLASLRTLYPIPPQKPGAPSGETDLHRLASMVALFLPTAISTTPPSAPPNLAIAPGGGIDTSRPPTATPPLAATLAAAPAPPSSSPIVINLTGVGKKRWLMHDELHGLLPEAVFTALDANAHLPAEKRFKLQEACKKSNTSALYDPATGAPFGHQLQLSLAEGAHFDPVKRGLALAVAGRPAGLESSASGSLLEATVTGRSSILLEFRTRWASIEDSFSSGHELSGTNVNRLWEGVSFVMQARAARATTWGCPEVELACKEQCEAIPAYRAAIATAVSRTAVALSAVDGARSVNSAYLNFFLPFWWEHVLLRSRLDEAEAANVEAAKTTKELLSRPPPPPYILPAPAPAPAAPRPPARPAGQPPAPGQLRPGPFLGKLDSPLIVGTDIGLAIQAFGRGCLCPISIAFPGCTHRPFECPIKYHAALSNCPGWTPAVTRIPACWDGDVLTDACRADWRTFVRVLPTANMAQGVDVAF